MVFRICRAIRLAKHNVKLYNRSSPKKKDAERERETERNEPPRIQLPPAIRSVPIQLHPEPFALISRLSRRGNQALRHAPAARAARVPGRDLCHHHRARLCREGVCEG